jgi:hypothetical protein
MDPCSSLRYTPSTGSNPRLALPPPSPWLFLLVSNSSTDCNTQLDRIWRRREVASEADGPGEARETAAAGGCCGLGDGCRMWWRGGVERREVAIGGRHMRATESQKGKPGHDDFGAGAGGRDRTTEIAQRQNRWLRLNDGRTAGYL